MSDWRAAHRQELLEKQRHISQKLAQLREFRALILKWRQLMRNYSNWFGSLQAGVESSRWFSVQSMIRMGSIMVQLNQLIGEFNQIGDSKKMGTGSKSTVSSTYARDKQQAATAVEVLTARAGPLANMAPWELIWELDPDTSESFRQGKYGAAITNAIFNPITSLGGITFGEEIAKQSIALFEEHSEEFGALRRGWKDTNKALNSISNTLDNYNWKQMRQLEENLESVLRKYESTYDGARGTDNTNARLLRQKATGK